MSELTDGLLALADIARAELQHQKVDLSELAAGILERLREHDPGREVDVQIEPTPPASGDRRLLADVMENLLGNAWKFTSRSQPAQIVFGAQTAPGGGLCYRVQDNGAGFDPAYMSKLFAPFQRLHTVAEFEGTGIGLAMVRKIITRHGGRIWAESQPGQGATFYFTVGEKAPGSAGA
jgi:light-regulated signal transduction histidine kinase (bacteriophytochrome)